MKKFMLGLMVVTSLYACKKEDDAPTTTSTETNVSSLVTVSGSYTIPSYNGPNGNCWDVNGGLGYSSTDVANNAFFETVHASGVQHQSKMDYNCSFKGSLPAGLYYYKVTLSYDAAACGSGSGAPADDVRLGSFTIDANGIKSVKQNF